MQTAHSMKMLMQKVSLFLSGDRSLTIAKKANVTLKGCFLKRGFRTFYSLLHLYIFQGKTNLGLPGIILVGPRGEELEGETTSTSTKREAEKQAVEESVSYLLSVDY